MKRHRLEDLGRLLVILESISQHAIFEKFDMFSKHYCIEEWLKNLDDEKKSDFYDSLRLWVSDLESKIHDCVSIARAHDELNCSDE